MIGGAIAICYPPVVRRILALLTIMVALFAGFGAPVLAETGGVAHSCVTVSVETHCDGVDPVQSDHQPVDAPASHHHHCTHALPVGAMSMPEARTAVAVRVRPSLARLLTSRAPAPPTQPPYA